MSYSLSDLLKETNYDETRKKFLELEKESPESQRLVNETQQKRIEILEKKPFEVVVSILDYAINEQPKIADNLLQTNNELIIRALLVLESLNDYSVRQIAESPEWIIEKSRDMIENNGLPIDEDTNNKMKSCINRIMYLSNYIKEHDIDEIEKRLNRDLDEFAMGLKNVQDQIFAEDDVYTYPTRSSIIYNLFRNKSISVESLSSIYYDVLCKNRKLQSFDISAMLIKRKDLIGKIKGIYRECDYRFFKCLVYENDIKDQQKKAYKILLDMIELNKDDTEGLKWFFSNSFGYTHTRRITNYFRRKKEFKSYGKDGKKIYDEAVKKLMNEESDVDYNVLKELGTYKNFLANYDVFLDKFVNSDDEEYQTALILPLVRGLIEKLKKKYGLSVDVMYTNKEISSTRGGQANTYSIYINKAFLSSPMDRKKVLANMIAVAFHEFEHFRQRNRICNDSNLDYNNLIMAIDYIMHGKANPSYYKANYIYLSGERDARDYAYVESLTFFDKYKQMQDLIPKEEDYSSFIPDYMRRVISNGEEHYVGIIQAFLDYVNSAQEKSHNKDNKGQFDYKVIWQFFKKDKNGKLVPKSDEYFKRKEIIYKLMPDCLKKREGLYSIRAFRYSLKVSRYLLENEKVIKSDSNFHNKDIAKEVVDNVGTTPTR